MIRRNAKKGLATLYIGGGQGVALAIEREQGPTNLSLQRLTLAINAL